MMLSLRRTGELAEMKKQLEKHALDVEVSCLLVLQARRSVQHAVGWLLAV